MALANTEEILKWVKMITKNLQEAVSFVLQLSKHRLKQCTLFNSIVDQIFLHALISITPRNNS